MVPFNALHCISSAFIERPMPQLWSYISALYMIDESAWMSELLSVVTEDPFKNAQTKLVAKDIISRVRADKKAIHMIDAVLLEYSLDTQEGIQLMCLAEALMRIPDSATADELIRDKLGSADWQSHLKHSDSIFVNASTWGLLITGKISRIDVTHDGDVGHVINRLIHKMSEPVIRQAIYQAMKIMGQQFVLGRNIEEAQKKSEYFTNQGFSYSYDMLGESALTRSDARHYFDSYMSAIESIGQNQLNLANKCNAATVSIKLSALHPRYEFTNKDNILKELFDTVLLLVKHARSVGVAVTIDAEEADRLELSLLLFEQLYRHPLCRGWGKLGVVIQAYSKRALAVLAWLAALAKQQGDCIPVRLVKGAYWDSEIKLSQQHGYDAYPVYTRKEGTDVSYLACARFLLSDHIKGLIYPQFATHNAHTVAAISLIAKHKKFEFQRLHGMGEALYKQVVFLLNIPVRIYAPVGSHKDLLPYLVRRLLENGANSSFVHRLVDANCPIDELTKHPADILMQRPTLHNGLIALPPNIFSDRKNSHSINIHINDQARSLQCCVDVFIDSYWHSGAIVDGRKYYPCDDQLQDHHTIYAPYDRNVEVGRVQFANPCIVEKALHSAYQYRYQWQQKTVVERANCLLVLADY
ncbi:bifunctional proline dehydrogenase/L-glutamate gamma-semialdehyde dehydrogenase PutA [Psychromonas sp. MME2]|uniref:bifunctional proline dehydrogenase/L-glutamate gamma-semialdehyde dehydrogenase PutA n=1 Tax=Psychromonas sp. MME2 TaxID=3231033 RepID=UPI00339CA5C6